jgi:hypothetical protein
MAVELGSVAYCCGLLRCDVHLLLKLNQWFSTTYVQSIQQRFETILYERHVFLGALVSLKKR